MTPILTAFAFLSVSESSDSLVSSADARGEPAAGVLDSELVVESVAVESVVLGSAGSAFTVKDGNYITG